MIVSLFWSSLHCLPRLAEQAGAPGVGQGRGVILVSSLEPNGIAVGGVLSGCPVGT